MKQIINLCLITVLFSILSVQAFSQAGLYITAGANFYISSGTSVSVDGLVLTPSVNYNIVGTNGVTRDATATPPPPTTYIQRVYELLQTLPAYSGDITIYYEDAELNSIPEAGLNLDVYNGSAWTIYSPAVRDATNNFVTTTGLSNIALKQLTLASLSVVPVTLSSFNVRTNNCIAILNWTTASEQNSKHFEVQQSTDGINFTSIGTVLATGNSSSAKQYSYTQSLAAQHSYFRLQFVDIDGSSKISPVLSVSSDCNKARISAFPNPAKTSVSVTGLAPNSQLRLFDAASKLISSKSSNRSTEIIDVAALPPGIYVLQILQNNVVVEKLKLVKE